MTYREVDGVSVLALDGRIVLGEESNALREKIKSLLAEGKKKIVLNMDNVTFIDSAGLGTLVASHHSVKTQGASLRLCHLGSKFQEVLQITKLQDRSRSRRQLLQKRRSISLRAGFLVPQTLLLRVCHLPAGTLLRSANFVFRLPHAKSVPED